ncbi:MAG: platelet-activating factor acetylhydrolase IB subunit [Balneolaceae bacterium]
MIHSSGLIGVLLLLMSSPFIGSSLNEPCPENASALTPATLQEEWAVEWWMPRHEEKLAEEGRESADLLFLGNSITQGWETEGKKIWDEYYADRKSFNIGFSGDRTENVLWRLEHGEVDGINPQLAILSIGTNNTGHRQDSAQCTAEGISRIVTELKDRLPDTKILVLAIFPRDESPEGELRQLNNDVNNIIESFADQNRVFFLDVNHVYLNEDGTLPEEIMPDHLHPNEYGYQLWAEAMEPMIENLLD